jgi:protein TonB
MSTNNNEDKSKIDKIREDLEKKLAALERAKLNTDEKDIENLKKDISEQEKTLESKEVEKPVSSEQSSFLDQISNIENETNASEPEVDKELSDDQDEAIFEISDEIEEIKQEEPKTNEIVPPIVPEIEKKDRIEDKKEEKATVVAADIDGMDDDDNDIEEEEEEKSSKVNYLIYGLVALLLVSVGYFAFGYMKGKNKLDSDKTNKKITELENRRYQDSIKLLEAEKRLAEFESQRYIDSISLADRLKLKVQNPSVNQTDSNKAKKIVKAAKPTTTIYKNNKPVATSKSTLNFDKVVASDKEVVSATNSNPESNGTSSELGEAVKDEKDKKIAKEVVKEKKIATLNTVDKAPIYPGCEKKKTERAKKTCMISKINKFVNKNFNAYVAQDLGLNSGLQRINVSFIIDRNGYVNVLRTRAKHEALKKEAVRVVNKLPRMKPALSNGKKTQIVYNLPIVFSVDE